MGLRRRRSLDDLPDEVRHRLELLRLTGTTPLDVANRRIPALGNRSLFSIAAGRHGTARALEFLQRVEDYSGRIEPDPWPLDREHLRALEVPGSFRSGIDVGRDPAEAVRQRVASAFGGRCWSFTYRNPSDTLRAGVLLGFEPSDSLALSTFSLHLVLASAPTELALVSTRFDRWSSNVLATSAFRAIENGSVRAGEIYEDAVRDYESHTATPHLVWSESTRWPGLGAGQAITWLVGRPITDAERDELRPA